MGSGGESTNLSTPLPRPGLSRTPSLAGTPQLYTALLQPLAPSRTPAPSSIPLTMGDTDGALHIGRVPPEVTLHAVVFAQSREQGWTLAPSPSIIWMEAALEVPGSSRSTPAPVCWVASEQIFQSLGSAAFQEQPHSSPCIGPSSAQSRGSKTCTESTGGKMVKEIYRATESLAFCREVVAHNLQSSSPHPRSALWPGHSLLCSPIPCTTDPSSHTQGICPEIQRSDGSKGQLHPEKPTEQTAMAHYRWDNNTHQHTSNPPTGRCWGNGEGSLQLWGLRSGRMAAGRLVQGTCSSQVTGTHVIPQARCWTSTLYLHGVRSKKPTPVDALISELFCRPQMGI